MENVSYADILADVTPLAPRCFSTIQIIRFDPSRIASRRVLVFFTRVQLQHLALPVENGEQVQQIM
jgi:hypothetical protein